MINPKYKGNTWFTALLLLSFAISFVLVNFTGADGIRQKFIDGDGSGIYAYLPTILMHKTVDFSTVFELEKSRRSSAYRGHYFHKSGDVYINKFSSGTALLQLPFFLLAWLASIIYGLPSDGYNILFQYAVAFAAIFWALTGLLFFVKLARLFQVKSRIAWITAMAGFFGTNLFYYTFMAPAASHVYSFAMIAAFLFFTRKTFVDYSRTNACLAAFSLGLVMLIRPVDIIVIAALPFLSGTVGHFRQTISLKLQRKDYLFTIFFFVLAISPQLIINLLQTGHLFVFGYRDEGFYFTQPAFWQFLFSYRKGWFVYTPLMLLLIPATVFLWKRSFFEMVSFTGFFALVVYIFSSWWNWIYGDSFSMRPMVDLYAIFFLVLALFMAGLKNKATKGFVVVFAALSVLLNLFQTHQYVTGIIHPDSMNREAYWHVFLKAGKSYQNAVANGDEYYYGELDKKPFFSTGINFEDRVDRWTFPEKLYFIPDAQHACIKLDARSVYSTSYRYTIPKSLKGEKHIYVVFEAEYLEPQANSAANALFVIDVSDTTGKTVFYNAFKLKRLPDKVTDTWRPGSIGLKLPAITHDMSTIKFYIWNKEEQEFFINSMGLKFYFYN